MEKQTTNNIYPELPEYTDINKYDLPRYTVSNNLDTKTEDHPRYIKYVPNSVIIFMFVFIKPWVDLSFYTENSDNYFWNIIYVFFVFCGICNALVGLFPDSPSSNPNVVLETCTIFLFGLNIITGDYTGLVQKNPWMYYMPVIDTISRILIIYSQQS
jgi:quinol-cytochrome oxidoreductase complex cytochrome b subunit